MVGNNFFGILVLCFMIGCAIASDDGAQDNSVPKKDEKTITKRGIFHYGTHGHAHPAIISSSHYHLPPSVKFPVVAKFPHHHKHILPIPVAPHVLPLPQPHYHITPGGASVTSFNVNYPRVPFIQKPIAFAPPVLAPTPIFPQPTFVAVPHQHHHHSPAFVPALHQHQSLPDCAPYYPPTFLAPKPIIPVAVPFPGIRQPKFPVFVAPKPVFGHQKPVYSGFPQFLPVASPAPTFLPVPIPSDHHHHQENIPAALNSGSSHQINQPVTHVPSQIPIPTQTTFEQTPTQSTFYQYQSSQQLPAMTSQGWRPAMMTHHSHHNLQPTQSTISSDIFPPYNYHASPIPMTVSFNRAPTMNDLVSGHTMSSQLAQQLALYQHQQALLQQHHQHHEHHQNHEQHGKFLTNHKLLFISIGSFKRKLFTVRPFFFILKEFPYPADAETFHQNYDPASNNGRYQGLSSYQVPIHQ